MTDDHIAIRGTQLGRDPPFLNTGACRMWARGGQSTTCSCTETVARGGEPERPLETSRPARVFVRARA